MEADNEQGLDSPSRNSYIGSYYQPPDIMIPLPRRLDFPFHSVVDSEQPTTSHRVPQKSNIDSQAVVDALKTLQEKISRVEAETSRHTENSRQMSQEAPTNLQSNVLTTTTHSPQATTENDAILKCKTLQKHLEKTKRCIEQAKKEQSTILENQTLLQKEQFNTSIQEQNEKLEKLESEYEKLCRIQTQSERKLAMLEEKLMKEEHERKLVEKKAEVLQREFDNTLRLSTEEIKVKKKTKNITRKTSSDSEQKSPTHSFNQKMPFVLGTSTSPSHSVRANVQSIRHMMKQQHTQLHMHESLLPKPVSEVRKGLHKDFSTSSSVPQRPNNDSTDSVASVLSLSDLLLALQDELGQMSFEQQELMHQIDGTRDQKKRQDLKNELERLISKMEDKGAQITMLRKHQQMIHKVTKDKHHASYFGGTQKVPMIHPPPPPAPSPVKPKKKTPKRPQRNPQLRRESQQFRNSLQQSDLFWET